MKDAVNMEDLICLLATVRTIKGGYMGASPGLEKNKHKNKTKNKK